MKYTKTFAEALKDVRKIVKMGILILPLLLDNVKQQLRMLLKCYLNFKV
tara:strand:+ start:1308 stop:1454 length:147 start_codon:yes stop_codon:yes gene_type:complete